jgi:hypothetical protein
VTFEWSGEPGLWEYELCIGIGGPGSADLYCQPGTRGLSATVYGLPTHGETIFVRLSSNSGQGWEYGDYTFTAMK